MHICTFIFPTVVYSPCSQPQLMPFMPRTDSEGYDSDVDMYDREEVGNIKLYRESLLVRQSRDMNSSFRCALAIG